MHGCFERGNIIAKVTRPIISVQGRHFELASQGMTCDGRNEGGISLVDKIIHMVCSSWNPSSLPWLFSSSPSPSPNVVLYE